LLQKAESPEETEEKRAKRLERNRESARKSRRRKKERLRFLEQKVHGLYGRVEAERRLRINAMNDALASLENHRLRSLLVAQKKQELAMTTTTTTTTTEMKESLLRVLVHEREQNVRREVVEFQYNSLSQHLLARYQKYLLWTILQADSYFVLGKEANAKRIQGRKISAGKISSKQIGEELCKQQQNDGSASASASDARRFWPLVCFELSISVEQEDRILEAQKRLREAEAARTKGNQMLAATRLTAGLKEAVLYQLYLSSFRARKTFHDILTPEQSIRYKDWLLSKSNRDRVEALLRKRNYRRRSEWSSTGTNRGPPLPCGIGTEHGSNLETLCRSLEESLRVSKILPTES